MQGPITTGARGCGSRRTAVLNRWSTEYGSPLSRRRHQENLLFALRLIPQRVHLIERSALKRTPLRRKRAFNVGEAAFELRIRAAQGMFRIGTDMPREVDQREQEIAGLFGERLGVATTEDGLDLVVLLADLLQHRARVVPVETDLRGPAL